MDCFYNFICHSPSGIQKFLQLQHLGASTCRSQHEFKPIYSFSLARHMEIMMSNPLYFLGNLRILNRFLQGILAISALIFGTKGCWFIKPCFFKIILIGATELILQILKNYDFWIIFRSSSFVWKIFSFTYLSGVFLSLPSLQG